jgi:hypothetical protein
MVGVGGVTGGTAAGRGRRLRGGASGFSLGTASAGATAAAQGAAPAQAIGLLALQEAGPVAERDARARKQGEALLQSLSDLQLGLLEGRLDRARLEALAALVPGEDAADPSLAAAIAAIRLRARVELARHGLDTASSRD